jgi:23S rRNA pseudouridine1911/1915/1917 synthase
MLEVYKKFGSSHFEVHLKAQEHEQGLRLDQFAALFLESFSRQVIKKKIAKNEIRILDRPGENRPSKKIIKDEIIIIETYPENDDHLTLAPPEVIFENDDIIVINKPPFMITHPAGRSLFYTATSYFENARQQKIHSIHRLDGETSGVMMLAKNPEAAMRYTQHFENNQVKKIYFFIAKKKQSTLNFPFTANERMGQKEDYIPSLFVFCYPQDSQEGKSAETLFEVISEDESYLLGLALPHTGRQHQIRAHAAFHGIPLMGDKLYLAGPEIFMRFKDNVATKADEIVMEFHRHALHCLALKFNQEHENNFFVSTLPKDLKQWLMENWKYEDVSSIEIKIKNYLNHHFL